MTLEDFTTYTENDVAGDRFSVASDTITYTALEGSEVGSVYRDMEIDGITNFTYQFKITCTAQSASTSYFFIFGKANDYDISRAESTSLGVVLGYSGGYIIMLWDRNSGSSPPYTDTYSRGSETGTWYFTLTRTGTTATLVIYSDESRETELDTLEITCTSDSFRYLGAGSDGYSSGPTFSGTLEDLDLGGEKGYLNFSGTGNLKFYGTYRPMKIY